MRLALLAAFGALCFASAAAWATQVYVMSVGRSEVQFILNGNVVRSLRPGQTSPEGVRLLEIRGNAALVEADGRQMLLALGQSTTAQTTLRADGRGQFVVQALVNGQPLNGLIDTGASAVVVNMRQAQRLGLDLRNAPRGTAQTANGIAPFYRVIFARVQVGDIVLNNVEGMVIDGGDERLGVVLIGMSFLRHVDMRRAGDTLTLTRPHLQ